MGRFHVAGGHVSALIASETATHNIAVVASLLPR